MFRLAIVGPAAILLAASAFPAAAQQQPAASMESTKSQPGVAGKVESNLALPTERLIGRKVHAMAGNDLGRIEDVLVTPDGNVKAVIAAGGVYDIVGADKKRVMIDWDKISFAGGPGKELVADVTLAELAATPDWIQDDARDRQSQASGRSGAASGDANATAGTARQATAMLNELSAAGYRPTSDFRKSGDRWLGHASKDGSEVAVVIDPSTRQIKER